MKKFIMLMALFLTTICLSACSCNGNKIKYYTFDCTQYDWTVYNVEIQDGNSYTGKIDLLKNYKKLQLIFYSNGEFKWVGENSNNEDEIFIGTFEEKTITSDDDSYKQLILTYKNNPSEQNNEGGNPYYILKDGVLTRNQKQITATSQSIIEQTFVFSK